MAWSQEFPTTYGRYWFYGYRYGKENGGSSPDNPPELNCVEVREVQNGFMYISDGQFMYPSEVECPNFIPAIVPGLEGVII